MATWTQGEVQDVTDRAAAVLALNLAGFTSELAAATNLSFLDQALALNSPRARGRALSAAVQLDEMSLPENYRTALIPLFGRVNPLVQALNAEATAADGGNAASLRAWLSGLSVTLHPLFAEAALQALGPTAFTDSDGGVSVVNPPAYSSRYPDRVYVGADGSLAEETTDATDVGAADITLFGSDDHTLYIGSRHKFSAVVVALSTLASATITPTFQYWNGASWAMLTATDNSAGLTRNDTITWTIPTDWERTYKDAGGTAFGELAPLYYVRIARTANTLVTPPVGNLIRIIPALILNAAGSHLGVDQPPLALVRITGTNAVAVSLPAVALDYLRFKEIGVYLRALTPLAAAITLTAAYTNQAGTDVTQAQSAWGGSLAAMDEVALTLNGADTGVRAVKTAGWIAATVDTSGVVEIVTKPVRVPAL